MIDHVNSDNNGHYQIKDQYLQLLHGEVYILKDLIPGYQAYVSFYVSPPREHGWNESYELEKKLKV